MSLAFYEVDFETLIMTLLDGSEWSINPLDFSKCCTWTPTSGVIIKVNSSDKQYPFIISNSCGTSVKASRIG